MSFAKTDDGFSLYYEEAGSGEVIIFVHEFAGDHLSWEPQLRFFSRQFRCLTFSARGYPPSDVPAASEAYSQHRAAQDIACVMDAAGIEKAHIVGLSMGGFATLHFGLHFPMRAITLTIAGVGYGAEPAHSEEFKALSEEAARQFESIGSESLAPIYGSGASRIQLKHKNARGWAQFVSRLAQHDPIGAANTMRSVQAKRPSLYDLENELRALCVPTLIITGDEDDHCIQPSIFLKKTIPACGLLMLPKTGHTVNLEEPEKFNNAVRDFIAMAQHSLWWKRDADAAEQIMQLTDGKG
ncbi:alpha/beta fold hydrolase [Pusillimonas sp. ANT_WB101]|uniref:alpha/beta fold hydrolase n=1 Tax=Pusillimonas sp. ANT_WB101 TaxID=2597356 RepID=UPI0011F049DD|nr:alpha/beta hydrolase [Pusillimonas sp. ANT_WB101]KAA0890875.1 alpha/beta hydrolase [Pusillimonas sp. ANT_WB101]